MKTRRDFLKMIGLGAASLAVSQNSGLAGPSMEKPNIVFFLVDDLGFKDVGYQGGQIKTPNIDALAAEGTRLDKFYVQPVCSPTRSSLLTGRYPMRYGLQVGVVRPWAQHGLPLAERTLAQALREAGYTTAICGKWHLGHLDRRYLPTSRGFDHQYGHYNGALDYFTHIRDKALDWNRDDKPLREKGYTTDLIAAESVRLVEKHDVSKPLFLYVPFNAPHSPFQAPQSYLDMYKHIKARNKRALAAMVTCLDDAIGQIISALNKRGMRRNTLIFFCSDNGGMNFVSDNGPLRGEKGLLYEGGIRVSAFAVWPGVLKAGAVVKEPLHMVDMYPTLLKLAAGSLEQPLPLDGKDAWSTIAKGKPSPHEEILLNVTPYNGAIRRGNWKLVHNGNLRANYAGDPPTVDTYELFNLSDDPFEKNDLSQTNPQKLRELQRRLRSYAAEAAPANVPPHRMPEDFKTPKAWGHPD
ncbi:MAG: arylsulfatase [Sedimentisphaerales bacterium]|nr:arylsulfatase [Sedimentisphaerales bacterium]